MITRNLAVVAVLALSRSIPPMPASRGSAPRAPRAVDVERDGGRMFLVVQ